MPKAPGFSWNDLCLRKNLFPLSFSTILNPVIKLNKTIDCSFNDIRFVQIHCLSYYILISTWYFMNFCHPCVKEQCHHNFYIIQIYMIFFLVLRGAYLQIFDYHSDEVSSTGDVNNFLLLIRNSSIVNVRR